MLLNASMKSISVVTVTYNSSATIKKLLNSFIVSKTIVKEIIIIENNSKDKKETEEVSKKYSDKLNIIFIKNDNVGFGKSCNLGANLASGDYLLFLNPDTELRKNSLALLIKHMNEDKADIIGGKAVNEHRHPHGSFVRSPTLKIGLFEFSNIGKALHINAGHRDFYYEDTNYINSNNDSEVDAVSGAYLLIRKSSFAKLNGFDENIFMYLEDVDLCVRGKEMKMKIFFCPHSIINHVGGASSDNKYKIRHQAWFDSRRYYYQKHFGLLTNMIIQPIYIVEEKLLKKFKSL